MIPASPAEASASPNTLAMGKDIFVGSVDQALLDTSWLRKRVVHEVSASPKSIKLGEEQGSPAELALASNTAAESLEGL